jgi:DNA polymerase-3 subunit alpha
LDDYRREMESFKFIPIVEMDDQEKLKSRQDQRSGGMVTSVNHRMTKAGKPYASFVMEDYTGNKEFMLFSEKYLKMKHFLVVGTIIYVNWKADKSFRNPDMLEPGIHSMGLMADLKDRYKQVTLNIHEVNLNEKFVNDLTELINRFPGKCNLRINLTSNQDDMHVSMVSENSKVDGTNPEFQQLMAKIVGQDFFQLN